MRRRDFVGLVALWASAASSSSASGPPARTPVIALFTIGRPGDPNAAVPMIQTVRQALAELGWVGDDTATIVVAHAQGRVDGLKQVAEDLVRRRVDVIVAGGGTVTGAASNATRSIPIVMSASAFDPVRQ
jgi:putative tryptophan/tyrosine transport system substrate-binding protein